MEELFVGFIGFGLIGGSIAKAIKELYPHANLLGYNYNKFKPNGSLELAIKDHILDNVTHHLDNGFQNCDIIFLCAPVLTNIEYLEKLKSLIKPTCILTDVGSVKENIHDAVVNLGLESNFIGGHPMAGSEKTGYMNANSKLLENAYYILTPTSKTPAFMTNKIYSLVSSMGALPLILDDKEHDDIVAVISHLPHIIAANLVNLVRNSDDDEEKMRALAAGGFKDLTRIASSSPVMWQNICLTNTKSIKNFLEQYIHSLQEVSKALDSQNADYLYEVFDEAREYRDSIPNKSVGMIKKIFEVYLDIIDEAGAIATIATILATNQISIKNIGIIHNREFQDGVLRIEFYNEDSTSKAVDLLDKYRYTIYER